MLNPKASAEMLRISDSFDIITLLLHKRLRCCCRLLRRSQKQRLVRIAAAIVNRIDRIEHAAIGAEGAARHHHDDAVGTKAEIPTLGRSGLRALSDSTPRSMRKPICS